MNENVLLKNVHARVPMGEHLSPLPHIAFESLYTQLSVDGHDINRYHQTPHTHLGVGVNRHTLMFARSMNSDVRGPMDSVHSSL
eukprot:COSAG02_NODE_720_length_18054_cov_23.121192_12_plen_84_part_00